MNNLIFSNLHKWFRSIRRTQFRLTRFPLLFSAFHVTLFGTALLLFASQPSAHGQYYVSRSFPTGPRPLGFAVTAPDFSSARIPQHLAVANSGDNSVSVSQFSSNGGALVGTAHVQAPYGVVTCGQSFLVTSSSGNTVTVLSTDGTVSRTINVGPQPYSAVCLTTHNTVPPLLALVSTLGDNALSLVNLGTGLVTMRIPNVPGSRALHGIVVDGNNNAWVAGTDANVVTLVNLGTGMVVTSLPVPQPVAVGLGPFNVNANEAFVASAVENNVTTYDTNTLRIIATIGPVASPPNVIGDVASLETSSSRTDIFATSGDSVVDIAVGDNFQVTSFTTPDIPGAFEVAEVELDGNGQFFLLATSRDSNALVLLRPGPAAPHAFGVTNGASYVTSQVAAGSVASAFGSTGVSQPFFVSALPLPTTLGGVTLNIGGTLTFNGAWTYSSTGSVPAPLSFVGPAQVNFQIPPGTTLGSAVPVQLTKPDGTTLLTTLNVVATAPGIFTILMNGQGQGAVLNQDYSPNGNPQTMVGAKPAPLGGVIQIYATGAGATNPPMLPGEAAPASGDPLVFTQVQPTVTVGGISARVFYSIMAPGFPGVWQVDAEVPQNVTPGFAVPLVISAGGVTSNTVTIAVQ